MNSRLGYGDCGRPTLKGEAERLLGYWEIHGKDPGVVAKWAVSDMLGFLRFIVEDDREYPTADGS